MSKFNLKALLEKQAAKAKAKDGDEHVERKLVKEHQPEKEVVTEKQLEKDRIPEKDVIVEKQLERTRTGSADKITEKNLNESKSKLVQHRNPSAYEGDINKVEELRLSKKTMESEKSDPASSTAKSARWWESLKVEAKTSKRTVQSQSVEEMDFEKPDARWGRVPKMWSDEEGVPDDPTFVPENVLEEEIGPDLLTIDVIKPIDSHLGSGLFASFRVDPSARASVEELQQMAYNKLIEEGYAYLQEIPDFTPRSFRVSGDKIIARLIGDEYSPEGKAGAAGVATPAGEDNPFKVADVQNTEVAGVVIGTVTVDPEMKEMVDAMDDADVRRLVMEAISAVREDLNIEPDGIDLNKLKEGTISFVGEAPVKKQKRRPESYEQVKGAPIASRDFDIVVLSEGTKKN